MNSKHILGVVIGITLLITLGATDIIQKQIAQAANEYSLTASRKAPVAITGDNVYVAWQTNKTSNNNEDVMFRASTDGGASFDDKINLSNTTTAHSDRIEIDSDANSVVVSWWESNETADTPVMRVSTDNGATFGPLLALATNGTIGEGEEEPEEGE